MVIAFGIVALYVVGVALLVSVMRQLARANERRERRELALRVGRLAAEHSRIETLFRAPPAGPLADALRSAQLHLLLDRTEPRA